PIIDIMTPEAEGPVARGHIHNARRRLGPEQIAQLVADYEAGSPSTQLMTTYGLGKGTVLRLLRKHGAKLRAAKVFAVSTCSELSSSTKSAGHSSDSVPSSTATQRPYGSYCERQ